jgi:hypothetical protein
MSEQAAVNNEGIPLEPAGYRPAPGQRGTEAMTSDNVEFVDHKTIAALSGMPPGETAEKLTFLEKEWDDWTVDNGHAVGTWPLEAFRILRLQIRELALAYSTEVAGKRALAIQADIGKMHIENQRQHAHFRRFLQQHFEQDVANGEGRNLTIFEMAQDIMLRAKPKWFEFWRR